MPVCARDIRAGILCLMRPAPRGADRGGVKEGFRGVV